MKSLLLISAIILSKTLLGVVMEPQPVSENQFSIIGIQTRTNNKAETGPNGKIGKLWSNFYSDKILEKIPNKLNSKEIFAVYTDYENDHNGDYTLVIGTKVTATGEVPKGMVIKSIPTQKYAKFNTGKGKLPGIIMDTWKSIHSVPRNHLGGNRSYTSDFEVYTEKASDPNNAEVDIFIAIKE